MGGEGKRREGVIVGNIRRKSPGVILESTHPIHQLEWERSQGGMTGGPLFFLP